jgi:hypothetical protein
MMLALVLVLALAAGSIAAAKSKAPKVKVTAVSCSMSIVDQVDSDGVPVVVAAEQGTQYGTVACNKLLGHGVMADQFTTNDAGDLTGIFQQYFNAGTVHGKFVLAQGDNGTPTPGSFASSNYAGTVSVLGGTGVYQGASGTDTMKCNSRDSLHLACTAKLKLK